MARVRVSQVIKDVFKALQTGHTGFGDQNLDLIENREWMKPVPDWQEDPGDSDAVAAAFDRTDLNDEVARGFEKADSDGTSGDYVLGMTQVGYLANAERAYRNRHATRVQCFLRGAAKHRALGRESGLSGRVHTEFMAGLELVNTTP